MIRQDEPVGSEPPSNNTTEGSVPLSVAALARTIVDQRVKTGER